MLVASLASDVGPQCKTVLRDLLEDAADKVIAHVKKLCPCSLTLDFSVLLPSALPCPVICAALLSYLPCHTVYCFALFCFLMILCAVSVVFFPLL